MVPARPIQLAGCMLAMLVAVPAMGAPPELTPKARAIADQGAAAFQEGRFPEAAARFREAWTVEPSAWLLFNAGVALERAEHIAEAIEAYEAFVTSEDAKARAVRDARKALKELRKRLRRSFQTVRVASTPPGAQVRSVAERFPRALGATPVVAWLPRGDVRLVFELADHDELEHGGRITSSSQAIEVTLTPLPPVAAPAESPPASESPPAGPAVEEPLPVAAAPDGGPREPTPAATVTHTSSVDDGFTVPVATWITGGVALGAVGTAIGLGVEATNRENATRAYSELPGSNDAEWARRRGEANDMALGANVAWGVAGAAAATAVVLLFALQPSADGANAATTVAVAPWLGEHGAGLALGAGF